jgi:hypothetical protein
MRFIRSDGMMGDIFRKRSEYQISDVVVEIMPYAIARRIILCTKINVYEQMEQVCHYFEMTDKNINSVLPRIHYPYLLRIHR